MTLPHLPPIGDPNTAAQLTARERRALLEGIGHVALTLGRSLLPLTITPEEAASEASLVTPIPASPAMRSRSNALTSPLERLHFLCALWAEIEGAVSAITRQPDSSAACVQRSISLARSQGRSSAAASVARSPRAASAWRHLHSADKQKSALHSPRQAHCPASAAPISAQSEQTPILERVPARVCDTWANRLTVSLLTHIEEEATVLHRLAEFCEARQEAEEAECLVRTARRVRASTFLRDCPGLRDSEQAQEMAGDNIGRCSAPYRVLYRAWRSLHHPLDFDWSGSPLLYLPALESWHLYEIWCYLQVAAALVSVGWRPTDSDLLRCTPNGMRLGLATGRASRLRFETRRASLSLYYQPLFASARQTAGRNRAAPGSDRAEGGKEDSADMGRLRGSSDRFAFVSRSHAMQPDIALLCRSRLILLDPKFKRYAEEEDTQDDINKMHTYRDAIVRYTKPFEGSQPLMEQCTADDLSPEQSGSPVSAAWCLFPGVGALREEGGVEEGDGAASVLQSPLYAYPVVTPEAPFGTAEVGAFTLRPGQPDTIPRLAEFLTTLLGDIV